MQEKIIIKGAGEHNLKNIDVEIPRFEFVVVTGLSGSGKSSLVFDTINKEGQRQYLESLGQVTDFLSKPKVKSISGLSPAISIEQRNSNKNPRSTVGTITEVYTYLRVLYARMGVRRCPKCQSEVSPAYIIPASNDYGKIDETATTGNVECPECHYILTPMSMAHFSFNKPEGACPVCMGIGISHKLQIENLLDMDKSVPEGAVKSWDKFLTARYTESLIMASKHYGYSFDIDAPVSRYNEVQKDFFFYGALSSEFSRHFPGVKPPSTVPKGRFEGIITNYFRKYNERINDEEYRLKLEKNLRKSVCPECNGQRLKRESREVTIMNNTILEIGKYSMDELYNWLMKLDKSITGSERIIFMPVFTDLCERIQRIMDVGLGYLSMEQPAPSLSAGEAQRLRLASLMGSGLTGVLYILDEPTIGLHPRDNLLLIKALKKLKKLGNSILVIEHDPDMIREADYIIDMGPGAGYKGGEIIVQGSFKDIIHHAGSLTGRFMREKKSINPVMKNLNKEKSILIKGASENNLKNLDVHIPLNALNVVTGVSGSGKSTLIFDILGKKAKSIFHKGNESVGSHKSVENLEYFKRFILVDQSPIGRTTRSNTATYTEMYTVIRNLFASVGLSSKRKYTPAYFSFNVVGGRCENCKGEGVVNIEMHFLPDVQVECPVCRGKRFKNEVLEVKYKNLNIYDLLELTIDEALEIFMDEQEIYDKLNFLSDVGLGYLKLGQPASTLSGGEAQRIKLAKELGAAGNGNTLYLLDEPTTGLHPEDIIKLMKILKGLVEKGNTVILIEHNLDVIKDADWIIDLGPEGGKKGGEIIFTGTPADLLKSEISQTGRCLQNYITLS
jgi:excinuclease ABC subunit A